MLFAQTLPVTLALAGAAMAKQITIQVSDANAGLFYSPNSIQAAVGDTVQFVFNPKNHTVTESSFAAPCVPLAAGNGFNSGFNPVAAGAAEQATFTYSVADTNPHWFYCAQTKGTHCQKGMVGVINPPAAKPENNVNSFAAAAAKVNETIAGPTIQGGQIGSIKAGSAGNSSSTGSASVSGTSYATTWTVTSDGAVVTKATTQVIAGFTAATVTSAWSYTSNGQVISTQTVAVQTVPVIATAAAGAANTPAANAGNHAVAGMGVAAAAGAVAALLI